VPDHLERIRKRLAVTAWRAGMDDPTLVVMLDKKGVERDQELRQGEGVPSSLDLDLDRRDPLALSCGRLRFSDPAHRRTSVASCPCAPNCSQKAATRSPTSLASNTASYT
jgi:hypothetical protein